MADVVLFLHGFLCALEKGKLTRDENDFFMIFIIAIIHNDISPAVRAAFNKSETVSQFPGKHTECTLKGTCAWTLKTFDICVAHSSQKNQMNCKR